MPDIQTTLNERQSTHGKFSENASVSQLLKHVLRKQKNWESLTNAQREALEVIAAKIARILCGDPNEPDHWHDIAGYSTLAYKELIECDDAIAPAPIDWRHHAAPKN